MPLPGQRQRARKQTKFTVPLGNAGIAEFAECVDIKAMEFDKKLVAFAKEKQIGLTIIGMDDPLVGGVVDAFEAEGRECSVPAKMRRSSRVPRRFPKIR